MKINVNKANLNAALKNILSQQAHTIQEKCKVLSEDIMRSEALRLAACIQRRINEYYSTYPPSEFYTRTDALRGSIRPISNVIAIPNGELEVTISFEDISGESVFSDGSSVSDVVSLVDSGWAVKKDVWFKDIEHFGHYGGFDFIKKGIADFEKSNKYNLKITPPG